MTEELNSLQKLQLKDAREAERNVLNHAGNPRYQLICWEPYSEKWIDPNNNYFCHPLTGQSPKDPEATWMVATRYGWPDGDREPKLFASETQALGWFVNFLYSRHVALQDLYERRDYVAQQMDKPL